MLSMLLNLYRKYRLYDEILNDVEIIIVLRIRFKFSAENKVNLLSFNSAKQQIYLNSKLIVCKKETIAIMNKNLQTLLSACEKPVIIIPENLNIYNSNLLSICNNVENKGAGGPIIIDSIQAGPSNSSTVLNIIQNNTFITNKDNKVLSSSQSAPNSSPLKSNLEMCCTICGKMFSRKENLIFHEKTHSNSNLFHCNTCSKSFTTPKSLMQHLETHQMEKSKTLLEPFEECEVCGKYFHTSCLSEHEKVYQNQTVFTCRFCEQNFYKKGLYIYHLKLHLKDEQKSKEPILFDCTICNRKGFSQTLNVSESKNSQSNNEGGTKLSINSKVLPEKINNLHPDGKNLLYQHRNLDKPPLLLRQNEDIHINKEVNPVNRMPILRAQVNRSKLINQNGEQDSDSQTKKTDPADAIVISDGDDDGDIECTDLPYKRQKLFIQSSSNCEICLNPFRKDLLLNHSKQHFELYCIDCGQYFSGIHDILQHEELMHRISCYRCTKCNKNITLKTNFIDHVMSHDEKPLYVCKVCYLYLDEKDKKKLSKFKLYLRRKVFQCDICCKILQTTNSECLRCNICHNKFSSEQLLNKHQEESWISNVKCYECNEYFHTTSDFHQHAEKAKNNCVISHQCQLFQNNSNFHCIKCFLEFPTVEELQQHCLEVEHFKCGGCGELFSDWEDLNSHLVLYSIVPCTSCKSFVLGEHSLNEHKKDCMEISPAVFQSPTSFDMNRNIFCVKCNDSFSKKESLIEHLIFMH